MFISGWNETSCRDFRKLELGQLSYIQVLEAYACIGGCVGGTFTLENAFIAKSKINRLVGLIDETQLKPYI